MRAALSQGKSFAAAKGTRAAPFAPALDAGFAFTGISGDDRAMTYPGGKGRIYRQLISLIPPHRTYIETHLGEGAIMRRKRPAKASYGVEMDPAVVARWNADPAPGRTIVHCDALDFLRAYPFSGDEFVYCDPPYLPSTRRRRRVYRFDCDEAHHSALLRIVAGLPCPVMVSGHASELYDVALAGWRRVEVRSPTQAGLRLETVWMNFAEPSTLHDLAHIGEGYREREQIRRRRSRLLARIRGLDRLEQAALLAALGVVPPSGAVAAMAPRAGVDEHA